MYFQKDKFYFLLLVSVILLITIPTLADAITMTTLSGSITGLQTKGVITKVEILSNGIVMKSNSNSSGVFSIPLPTDTYTIKLSDYNQTIPNMPAYYDVERSETVSITKTDNISFSPITFSGSGLKDISGQDYNGEIQLHTTLNMTGFTGFSGDLVQVSHGSFTAKLLPTLTTFTVKLAGQNIGVTSCIGSARTLTIEC